MTEECLLEKYHEHKAMLFRVAFSYLGNVPDCEDVLQEAFLRLYYKAPTFGTSEDEKRWLLRVTINLCKNTIKANQNRKCVQLEEWYDSDPATCESGWKENLLEMYEVPDRYRIVLYLFYYEEYSIKEIARILKITQSAVKMRLKRGKEKLGMSIKQDNDYKCFQVGKGVING